MQWRLLKLFPQGCAGVRNDEGVTERQWLWLQCQMLLDDGMQACAHCQALGMGPYCSACGTRLTPEPRTCDECQMTTLGAYCQYCGTEVRSSVEDAIDAGTFDWAAWTKGLTPFLGGLTPQEEMLMARG